jgi:hypothetical protein
MLKRVLTFATLVLFFAGINSCAKNEPTESQALDQSVISRIQSLGFNPDGAYAADGGYIVEGDIFLTDEDLNRVFDPLSLIIAEEEQYHTFNLVTGLPRTITISTSGSVNTNVSNAINAAIGRYNAENLQLTFQRVSSGGNIVIKMVNGGGYIASAGFPSDGNPYPQVKFNKQYQNYSLGFVTTVIAHEVGHCIGFRHTDYMNRSYSCGSGGNEGQENDGVGAVHIPGTPTGPDAASWMLACLSATTDRPFNSNDKVALNYLY